MALVNRALQKTVGPRFFWNNVAGVYVALLAVLTTLTFFFLALKLIFTYFFVIIFLLPPVCPLIHHISTFALLHPRVLHACFILVLL